MYRPLSEKHQTSTTILGVWKLKIHVCSTIYTFYSTRLLVWMSTYIYPVQIQSCTICGRSKSG